ncbi:hypothetical protein BC826DRAFT_1103987 [Russula brevipes]|nr:hypothetical protein BC826DRAFT_1103987 [Russula brevipes]
MARRSSTVSLSSPPPSSTGLYQFSKATQSLSPLSSFRTPTSPWPPRNTSFLVPARHPGVEDPDELFTKLSVPEVKRVHQRLLTDADAKQEELRLMRRERYRDLLQASSSIISIAQSSRDTLDALEDIKASIPAEIPQLARRAIVGENDDTQLRILQKKKYLHAGWLFLLARIIYQALVRDDAEDEDDWTPHGIDVLEQFPLVQRQWDAVAQLRAQITYKATLSLRHLLDSPDITSPRISAVGGRTVPLPCAADKELTSDSIAEPKTFSQWVFLERHSSSKVQKAVVREVREGLEGVLEAMASTVGVARDVFHHGVMKTYLSYVYTASSSTLPSASHFILLPTTIRSYKPFVDFASATSSVSSEQLALQLSEWFSKAVTELRKVAKGWFAELRTLKEVRAAGVAEVIDDVAHGQAVKILRTALGDLQDGFRDELQDALLQLREGTSEALVESIPAKSLFQPVAPPSFDVGVGPALVAAFRKYESTLQRQVAGRTPLLHKVMSSLENGAKALQEDSEGKLTEKLRQAYAPLAEGCCKAILAATSSHMAELNSGTDADVRSLAFLSRLTEALHASPSIPISNAEQSLASSVNQWRVFVVTAVLADYQKTSRHARSRTDSPSSPLMQALLSLSSYIQSVDTPSNVARLKNANIAMTTLGHFTTSLVDALTTAHAVSGEQSHLQAKVWDLRFLRRLMTLWRKDWDGLSELDQLIEKLQSFDVSENRPKDDAALVLIEQHLLRTQILLAPLLPPTASQPPTHPNKSSAKDTRTESLLQFGVPAVEQTAQPVMDLAKPGPRFGSLLVGGTHPR